MGAIFDETGKYRYLLWRDWHVSAPRLCFVMLNPSTADAEQNDPTIRRCIGFARQWGYGGIEVVNLFAYCTSNPKALCSAAEPVGADNDRYLTAVSQGSPLLLAWGNGGCLYGRDRAVLRLFDRKPLYCLGTTRQGQPRHPLYLSRSATLRPFSGG